MIWAPLPLRRLDRHTYLCALVCQAGLGFNGTQNLRNYHKIYLPVADEYRDGKKVMQILLNNSCLVLPAVVKQEQEEISRNHVPSLFAVFVVLLLLTTYSQHSLPIS